ncbi:hypothetical protein [Promicromonospora soli]
MSLDPTTGATPGGRSRLRLMGAVSASLLLFALAQPPAPAHGQPLSSTPTITALRTGTAGSPAEARMLLQAVWTEPSLTMARAAVLAARPSEVTTGDHHTTTIAGIPAPIAAPVGAIILVLVIVVAIAARTRHRPDDQNRASFDPEDYPCPGRPNREAQRPSLDGNTP